MRYYIGIDPGLDGGVAVLGRGSGPDEQDVAFVRPMPTRPLKAGKKTIDTSGLKQYLLSCMPGFNYVSLAVIEEATAMRKGGKEGKPQGAVSMLSYGKGAGKIIGALEWEGIPVQECNTRLWKGKVLAGTTKDKDAAINLVLTRFPSLNIKKKKGLSYHDGMADAVCIVLYAQMLGCEIDP